MSTEAPETGTPDTSTEEPQEGPRTFDEEYVKKLRAESAKYRTEAKANADAAKRLAEIEEANKTEAQKTAEALAAAQRDAEKAAAEALRWKIAAKFQVSDEDAELFLTGTDEDTLTKQAQRLSERTVSQRKNGNHVPREGTSDSVSGDDRDVVRAIFGGNNS